jgi:hypothetical protein
VRCEWPVEILVPGEGQEETANDADAGPEKT